MIRWKTNSFLASDLTSLTSSIPSPAGITAGHGQSKGDEDGIGEKSNTPISNWAESLVTGELISNPIEDGRTLVQLDLAANARDVFRTQDQRLIFGLTHMIRLWQFNGSSSSRYSLFNINEDGLIIHSSHTPLLPRAIALTTAILFVY